MSVSSKDAADYLRKKYRKKQEALDLLFDQATEDAQNIIFYISENYPVQRIYQWGSLLKKEHFREYSDIDIAIEGILSPEVFFRLLGETETMTRFSLDIVQLEKIEPLYTESIIQKGKLIYERTR